MTTEHRMRAVEHAAHVACDMLGELAEGGELAGLGGVPDAAALTARDLPRAVEPDAGPALGLGDEIGERRWAAGRGAGRGAPARAA